MVERFAAASWVRALGKVIVVLFLFLVLFLCLVSFLFSFSFSFSLGCLTNDSLSLCVSLYLRVVFLACLRAGAAPDLRLDQTLGLV